MTTTQSLSKDTFKTEKTLEAGGKTLRYWSIPELAKSYPEVERLPFSLKILLENLLRREDGGAVSREDIEALAKWDPKAKPATEIAYMPARVLLQDFTGVPAVVDLAAMRDAIAEMGGDPKKINPLRPADLVVDHSVQVDRYGTPDAFSQNVKMEFERNQERYGLLRWAQGAFDGFRVVPPGSGIVHQVNLEYLSRVVFEQDTENGTISYPDTLVGTDSHTTMVNGMGVMAWGVGGIEAEAAMLGQPISMLIPQVVGFKLSGRLEEGVTATDLVLRVVEMLRQKGVVGKFVEFFGPGLSTMSLADRATVANMAPEYGATMGFFPVDEGTLEYLRLSSREDASVDLVEGYCKAQGLFRVDGAPDPVFTDTLELDLSTVVPSLAGPKRPQDRISLNDAAASFAKTVEESPVGDPSKKPVSVTTDRGSFELGNGAVVIAAITSCTNTSNPRVMLGAGLLAKKAVEKGLSVPAWVKTSLAPGSKVVIDYLKDAGVLESLEALGFYLVGYGCTTCIGNSGPLHPEIEKAIDANAFIAAGVLSGNRNFEGRVSPHARANYLASPPLVVAYALAGSMKKDLTKDPLGTGKDGKPVYLKDVWPTHEEVEAAVKGSVREEMFSTQYGTIFEGDAVWQGLETPKGERFAWDEASTYIRKPSFFEGMGREPRGLEDIVGARCLALLGDSVTTDHISPAGKIAAEGAAARYLEENGVVAANFNSFGSRRGNHEVMMRGTFGNIRLRNLLAPGTEGSWTRHLPSGEKLSIYDAAMRYKDEGVPLVVLGGKEYGTGSSRDWAAKGTLLLGVRAVLVESFERIHRSNLVGMGVLPLQFKASDGASSLGLNGEETFTIRGLSDLEPGAVLKVEAGGKTFEVLCRLDTPQEVEYYRHGGILQYVLRGLL